MCALRMRGCSFAAQRGACCVHSCHRIHRYGGASNAEFKHNRGLCCAHDPFVVLRLVFVRGYGACTHFGCVSAALLLSGALAACTAATGFADVAVLAIAELSTTEDFAARTIRLLCRGLFSCVAMVHLHDSDA